MSRELMRYPEAEEGFQGMKKTLVALGLSAVAVLALAGCSSSTPAVDNDFSVVALEKPYTAEFDAPIASVVAGDKFILTLGDSSSCPPSIDTVTVKGKDVTVRMNPLEEGKMCTMDFVPYSFEVTASEKGTFDGESRFVLERQDSTATIRSEFVVETK